MRNLTLALIVAGMTLVSTALATPSPSASGAKACSSKGLRFTYKSGGQTSSEKVTKLHATGATCKRARGLASTVARRLLHKRKVPAKIGRFHVVVKSPCKTCSPVWQVTATSGKRKITFKALGGA